MWGPENGLTILNPHTGEIEFSDETLCPEFYHPYAGVFLEIDEFVRFTGIRLV